MDGDPIDELAQRRAMRAANETVRFVSSLPFKWPEICVLPTFPHGLRGVVRAIEESPQPWPAWCVCSVPEFLAYGGRGDALRIPIAKPRSASSADFVRFTHPMSPERFEEMADEMRANTHILLVEPDIYMPPGRVALSMKITKARP